MYRHCIYCRTELGSNDVVESFPVGRRLAFDAAKGRLWVVCRRCERWNLTPLEERWEAVEDCERRFRACRTRVSTDNIGLARLAEGLELVRIGPALRPEFAAWRYGDQFGRRRRRAVVLGTTVVLVSGAVIAGHLATGMIAGGVAQISQLVLNGFNLTRAVRIAVRVPAEGGASLKMRLQHLRKVRLVPDSSRESDLGWQLEIAHAKGTALLGDRFALHALGLIMPKINERGGSRRHVQEAVRRIETAGGPTRLVQAAARQRPENSVEAASRIANEYADKIVERMGPPLGDPDDRGLVLAGTGGLTPNRVARPGRAAHAWGALRDLPLSTRLAVEMAVNEDNERAAMEGELELLELAWRDSEEIAAVADNLLVPQETEQQLERLRRKNRA